MAFIQILLFIHVFTCSLIHSLMAYGINKITYWNHRLETFLIGKGNKSRGGGGGGGGEEYN